MLNLNSLKSIEERTGAKIDPRRFRANLVISGLPAWEEFGLLGMRLKVGDAELEIMRPALRCPATSVDPDTGERDLTLPADLQEHFGHAFCAMYARVAKAGTVKTGDEVSLLGSSTMRVEEAFNERAPDYAQWPRIATITDYQIGGHETQLSLQSASPWPLPNAKPGQRIRFHLDGPGWTFEEINVVLSNQYQFKIEDSKVGDPLTKMLRHDLQSGQTLVISGPFGKGDDSAFAIHRMELKYGPPAIIDDLLTVRTVLQKLTGARSFLRQEVLRKEASGEEVMLCGADVEVAFINHGGGAKRFPDDLRAKLEGSS